MKYKDFSPDIWKKIEIALSEAKKFSQQPIAAFDADGTLWDTDLGEAFFHYLIDNKKVPLPPNPWEHYENLKTEHAPTAYLWLAQICKGFDLSTIRQWATECVKELPPPLFEAQQKLIGFFLKEGVKVYIITASVKWSVEPGAVLLGLQQDDVLGVETIVEKNIITNIQKGEITYREGKVKPLLAASKNQKPFFCSGNSEGDQELLGVSTELSLAVSSARRDDKLFRTESKLLKLAEQKGWQTHRFVDDSH